jgi:hypothetical protein
MRTWTTNTTVTGLPDKASVPLTEAELSSGSNPVMSRSSATEEPGVGTYRESGLLMRNPERKNKRLI